MNWAKIRYAVASALCLPLLLSCFSDREMKRVKLENHSRSFRHNLEADLVESAARDNRQIEAIAAELSLAMGKRAEETPLPEYEEDRELYRNATEIAVANWLALARHYAATGRYAQARASYRRVLEHYTAPRYRTTRAEAQEGLQEFEVLDPAPAGDRATGRVLPR